MQFTKSNILVLGIFLAIICLVGYFTYSVVSENKHKKAQNNPAAEALAENSDAPRYTSLKGDEAKLSDYLGEVVVVNSWASWSPYSVTELPALANLLTEYNDHGTKLVAINRAENSSTAERFLGTIQVENDVVLILDPGDRFYKSIGGYSMPETVVYDEDGNIIYHSRGPANISEIRAVLDSHFKQDKR